MTNEGALEHYNFDENKVKRNFQSATSKKPLRGKPASDKSLWTDEEEQALVVFILHWQIKQKPKMIRSKPATPRRKARAVSTDEGKGDFRIMPAKSELWDDCAKFISRKACLPKRTGQFSFDSHWCFIIEFFHMISAKSGGGKTQMSCYVTSLHAVFLAV